MDFVERSSADRVYLLGHSMGTRALTQAYVKLLATRPDIKSKVVELILAAPDLDADIFKRDIVPLLLAGQAPVTLYASSDDKALSASKAWHGSPRAGEAGKDLITVPGIESIDATSMKTDFLNHSYFATNRSILVDIAYILRQGLRPQNRADLERVSPEPGISYWRFKK